MNKIKLIAGIVAIIGIATLSITCRNLYRKLQEQKLETERYQNNYYLAGQRIDSLVTENGDFRYSINSMRVTLEDLETTNIDLYRKLEKSDFKIKNLEGIISTQSQYIINLKDSLEYYVIAEGTDTIGINSRYKIFELKYSDKWLELQQKLRLSTFGSTIDDYWSNISITTEDFHQELNNDFDIANELLYRKKKWWQFWKRKKVIGVKSHIITDNPYLKIRTIESYTIID